MLSSGVVKLANSKQELRVREAKCYLQKGTKWASELSFQRNKTLLCRGVKKSSFLFLLEAHFW